MAEVTAKDVAELRKATGAGILDCRRALQENDGDMEKAKQWLREQGLAGAGKRGDRERAEGAVSVVVTDQGRKGAVVALECETDFVAKSADFVRLVDSLAEAFALDGEAGIAKYQDEIDQLKVTLKENIAVGRHERFEAPAGAVLDSYLHIQNGRGVNGVLVELTGGTSETRPRHRGAHRLCPPRVLAARRRAGRRRSTRKRRPSLPSRATRTSPRPSSKRSLKAASTVGSKSACCTNSPTLATRRRRSRSSSARPRALGSRRSLSVRERAAA